MRYNDKSLEEVTPILDAYQKAYEARNGRPPDTGQLRLKLEQLAHQKEEEAFHNAFEHLTPASIRMVIRAINEPQPKPEPPPPPAAAPHKKDNKPKDKKPFWK